MALVNYSDSETSDAEEAPSSAPAPSASKTASLLASSKPTFQKFQAFDSTTERRKIKVDLPALKSEMPQREGEDAQPPPAKRAKTAGAFSGFNALLPAPKRSGANAPKAGTSLKTSGEAAFSRNPVPSLDEDDEQKVPQEEVKVVGKATRFKPLSVGTGKKKTAVKKGQLAGGEKENVVSVAGVNGDVIKPGEKKVTAEVVEELQQPALDPPPKPKRSLFSVLPAEKEIVSSVTPEDYVNETYNSTTASEQSNTLAEYPTNQTGIQASNQQPTLSSLAADLDLTPAQRRQLFGRNPKQNSVDSNINIAHFDMNNEYASNEALRQAGEVVEHRAVKAIAPGKHSLQQLVNNARTQKEGLEDKWAAGQRARGGVGGGRAT